MTVVVISQPMLFPWVGMLEQIALADVFVYYDDAQFSKGSFTNRVQVKTPRGIKWLTVPLEGLRLGQRINEVRLKPAATWQRAHFGLLEQAYRAAPCVTEMLSLVERVYSAGATVISELSIESTRAVTDYFGLFAGKRWLTSSSLDIEGHASQRVRDIVAALGGSVYVTGHGARNYLDHELFERAGIEVRYMDYRKLPYPQLHGAFTPFVSSLDLIANLGTDGRSMISSGTIHWKEFIS